MLRTKEEPDQKAPAPIEGEVTTPAGRKVKTAKPSGGASTPAAPAFARGDVINVSSSDSDGIFLKTLTNGNARVVDGRNSIEVMDMAVLVKLNAKKAK